MGGDVNSETTIGWETKIDMWILNNKFIYYGWIFQRNANMSTSVDESGNSMDMFWISKRVAIRSGLRSFTYAMTVAAPP
jgi:hypothetical protein